MRTEGWALAGAPPTAVLGGGEWTGGPGLQRMCRKPP